MARKKRKKGKTKRISFRTGSLRKKKKQETGWFGPRLINILKVLVVICVLAGIVVGIVFLEKYVKKTVPGPQESVSLELANVPEWVSEELQAKILAAAGGQAFRLDEDAAQLVAENLASAVWLDEVKVQTKHDRLRIEGQWRRPLALVKSGLHKFYVDTELVVLDFVPVPRLPIVTITGLSLVTKTPPPGKVWQRDDLAAAVTILDQLSQMDKFITPDKPLLSEIDSINVSNFEGRADARFPHIVLYAKDNTEITWGAEVGKWQRYLESTDEEKLAKLYSYYKEHGTLLGSAKYINLRDPQDNIPLPIDKY
ncbi:MAG: cell division protein FtsQ/DivIB [Planctomycetota bacterium]